MKDLVVGEYALFGENKVKRIYLGTFNERHLAVYTKDERMFNNCQNFNAVSWGTVEAIKPEPILETRWRMMRDYQSYTDCTNAYLNQKYIDSGYKEEDGWYKGDSIEVEVK